MTRRWRRVSDEIARIIRQRLRGRDLTLLAAALTFFSTVAIVPGLQLSLALTSWFTSRARVEGLRDQLTQVLPDQLGAPGIVVGLVDSGAGLSVLGAVLARFPTSFYGEGLRRVLLRFRGDTDTYTGWRGRLALLPLLLITPALFAPLLLVTPTLADLARRGGAGASIGSVVLGYYTVLAVLLVPVAWIFRVVAAGKLGWRAVLIGSFLTAASLAGFLQGFVLFLALPLPLGSPFGGLVAVGGVVAVELWLFMLHLVLISGWVLTVALDHRRRAADTATPTDTDTATDTAPPDSEQ